MTFSRLITCVLGLALGLAHLNEAEAATPKENWAVQTLANFGALQRLAAKGDDPLCAYVHAASTAYIRAGYDDFGSEFRRSGGKVIAQFSSKDADVKTEQEALRRLQRALERDNFYTLPTNVGESIPNYRDIATVFLSNTKTALKNIGAGKPIGHKLAGKTGTLWLTRTDRETVEPTDSYNFSFSSGGVIATNVGILDRPKTVAFPPGIALPPEDEYKLVATLGEPDVFGDVELPSGTLLVTVPSDFVLPEGTVLISPFGLPFGGFSTPSFIGNFSVTGVPDTRWVAFPPDTVLPANPLRPTFRLNASYTVNEIALPGGTLIRQRHDSFPIPEGATDLGGPGLQAIQTGSSIF